MTSQTKHYVELTDIVAIRCECRRCGASVSLPVMENVRTEGLQCCPSCNEHWAQLNPVLPHQSIEPAIRTFIGSLTTFKGVLERTSSNQSEGGFRLTLEVKGDASREAV